MDVSTAFASVPSRNFVGTTSKTSTVYLRGKQIEESVPGRSSALAGSDWSGASLVAGVAGGFAFRHLPAKKKGSKASRKKGVARR
eukprot:4369582-Amphidinium_carterae.2